MNQMAERVDKVDKAAVEGNNKTGPEVFKEMSSLMFESGLDRTNKVGIILGLVEKLSHDDLGEPPVFSRDQSDEIIEVIRDINRDNLTNPLQSKKGK